MTLQEAKLLLTSKDPLWDYANLVLRESLNLAPTLSPSQQDNVQVLIKTEGLRELSERFNSGRVELDYRKYLWILKWGKNFAEMLTEDISGQFLNFFHQASMELDTSPRTPEELENYIYECTRNWHALADTAF